MEKYKRKIIFVATILIVIGAAFMLTAFGFMGFDTNELSTANVATKNYDIGEKFDSIKIEDSDCNVQIADSTNGKCSVVFHGNDKMEIVPKVEDGVLNLEMNENRGWYKFIGLDYAKNDLLVYLPSDEYKDLKIKSNSTDIFVDESSSFQNVNLETTSGDLRVTGKVTNVLEVKTASGVVNLDNAVAGKIKTETTSGDINCNKVIATGDLDLESKSGDVSLIECDGKTIEISTTSGDVSGTLLTEKKILADSSSGKIFVPNFNVEDVCKVTTNSGDIMVNVTK